MYKYLFLLLSMLLLFSCTEERPAEAKCDPICDYYENCINSECKTKSGFCANDSECSSNNCNLNTHKCGKASLCQPECDFWQICDEENKKCKTKEDFCEDSRDCLTPSKPVCSKHRCVPESNNCSPACDHSWQYCLDKVCLTRLGRCGDDRPCSDENIPLCDTDTHICIEQSQGCDPQCELWQVCNSKQECVTKGGFCNSDDECNYDPNFPFCNLTTHKCKSESIDYLEPITYDTKALIITKNSFKAKFEELALIHTLTGVPTEVITISEICNSNCDDSDKTKDSAKAIKDYIISKGDKIKYVLLGGDIEVVPSRKVHDTFKRDFKVSGFTAYSVDYDDNFHTDYYYADYSEWDNNHDGIYAEDGIDTPDYTPEIAVSRLPVSTTSELDGYIKKAKSYLTDYYDTDKIEHVLILTNVATDVEVPINNETKTIPMDAANYIELDNRTRSIIEHNTTGANIDFEKLYNSTSSDWGSKKLKCDSWENCNIKWAIEENGPSGYDNSNPNFIIHMGHGSQKTLMTEFHGENAFSGEMANKLRNDNYSIMLSCACQAATFSCGSSQAPSRCRDEDSAGERFVINPKGGGIAYLGDASYGLGVAGGAQMMDEFLKYAFNTPSPLIGDAIFNAHKNLPHSDTVGMTVAGFPFEIEAMNPDAYQWTQKVATFIGDIMLPIWNSPKNYATEISSITKALITDTDNYELYFKFKSILPAGSKLIIKTDNGNYYEAEVTGSKEILIPIKENPKSLKYGFHSNKTLYMVGEKSF